MRSKKDNPVLASLVDELNKGAKPVWKRIAKELSRSRRQRVEVNVSKLEQYCEEGSTVIVPGSVLGSGSLSKKGVTVAAFRFSENAKKLIKDSGGKAISISNLYKSNPEGRGVVIIK